MEQYCLNNSHCECCVHVLSMTTDRSVIQHYSCHWFPPSLPLSYSEHHSRVHNMPCTLYNTHISVHPLLSLVVLHVVLYELGRYICVCVYVLMCGDWLLTSAGIRNIKTSVRREEGVGPSHSIWTTRKTMKMKMRMTVWTSLLGLLATFTDVVCDSIPL